MAIEPLALPPREAAAMLGCSKRHLMRLIAAKKIVARKCGKLTLVDLRSLRKYYAGLPVKTVGRALFPPKDLASGV
jgi:excisionase family DNA binding protein